jgi:hypothetical protein
MAESGGQEAEKAEDRTLSQIECTEGVGKFGGQVAQGMVITGDTAGVAAVTDEVPEWVDNESLNNVKGIEGLGQGMEELGEERGVEKCQGRWQRRRMGGLRRETDNQGDAEAFDKHI